MRRDATRMGSMPPPDGERKRKHIARDRRRFTISGSDPNHLVVA
jgi:hypothetical protein